MRDTLTALAGAVILILVAALAAPPFIDWAGQRALIDRAISSSLGVSARSDGRIGVQLLPYPRLRLDHLRLGESDGQPELDARFVKAELALAPLLKGEFRFTETRIGRAELTLPVAERDGDAVVLPADLLPAIQGRDLVIDDLRVQQALVTTRVPATGRTEQFQAEGLRLKAPALTGPWQAEGASGGVPFRLATTAIGPGGVTVKLTAGDDARGRIEADARVLLKPLDPAASAGAGTIHTMIPEAEGSVRLVVGTAADPAKELGRDSGKPASGPSLPFSLNGTYKARGALLRFDTVNAEIAPGGQAVRLAGSGRFDLRALRAGLTLEARRLNLDSLLASSGGRHWLDRALAGGGRGLGPGLGGAALPVMLDLDLKVEDAALGAEAWSDLRFTGTFDRGGGLVLRRLSATAPGAARLDLTGEFDTAPALRFDGHVALDAGDSAGLGRALRTLGAEGPALALLDGRAVRGAGDVSATADDLALRGLRLTLGEARLSGNARFTGAGAGTRGRLLADLDAQGLDIADVPPTGGWLPALDRHDIDLSLRARDLRYGPAGARSGNGTLTARIQSDGKSLVVERLDLGDLAGANARLRGRIAPDGDGRIAGRIAGHVTAASAAPLLALLDRVWIPEVRLLPAFLREGALDLDVGLEREAGQADTLRTTAKGMAADSALDASILARAGRLDRLDATLRASRAGRWFGRDDLPALNRPATLTLGARREAGDAVLSPNAPLSLTVNGDIAGLALSTVKPVLVGADAPLPETGTLRIATADAAPYLALAGSAAPGTLPADLTLSLSRKSANAHAELNGRVAESEVAASLERMPDGALAGTLLLDTLSLPGLVSALVLPTGGQAAGQAVSRAVGADTAGWSQARFAPAPRLPRTDLSLRVGRLDLGRGLSAEKAAFALSLDDGVLALKNLSAGLGGGRIAGSATLARQDGVRRDGGVTLSGDGSLTGAAIEALAQTPIRGRFTARLRYSASGESPSALIEALGGSGEIGLSDLVVPGADPSALDRVLTRLLGEDDPLREGRLTGLLAQEFLAAALSARGPVTAPATLVGGVLRSGALDLDLGPAHWGGGLVLDLARRRLDARGTLVADTSPKGWTGEKPALQLGITGPLSAPQRDIEAGALGNGLAALVLQRELETIELFDADQSERQRRRARIEMDRARIEALRIAAEKAAAEKAARERAAVEDAARAARARAQQAAAEEAARQERDRRDAEEASRTRSERRPDQPLDIRPPPP